MMANKPDQGSKFILPTYSSTQTEFGGRTMMKFDEILLSCFSMKTFIVVRIIRLYNSNNLII